MAMEHQNHPFDSPNPLRNQIRPHEPGTTASSPRNLGFHSNVLATSAPPANSRNITNSGTLPGGLFSNRSIISANWRNTNIATSHNDRGPFVLLPSYHGNESNILQFHRLYENQNQSPPEAIRAMSSPTSPQANATPKDAGTSHGSEDPGNNNNINPGDQSDRNASALAQVSKVLTQTTLQQQQQQQQSGGRRAGQTDMPYYAYCFDRGNGQYTRLIPADMLPPLVDIPALQQGCLGMTVLPCPTGLAPNGRSSNLERVFVQVSRIS